MSDQLATLSRRRFLWTAMAAGIPAGLRPFQKSTNAAIDKILMDPTDRAWRTKAPESFQARFETSKGDFVVEVRRGWAPLGADRFYNLVLHRFYDNQRFTRVVAGYITQFGIHGDPKITAIWKNQTIPDDPVLQSNKRGFIAYAMTAPNTRSTQVYINLADNSRLDSQGFAPFGFVKEGMDTVDKIYSGYGENAGGGMRAGRQGPLETGGNAYLDREFPGLDSILRVRIIR
jgi:homoserine O-acetyltransferase/O-succinyltransferase